MKTFIAHATQFIRPHGERRRVNTNLPATHQALYNAMTEARASFEIEVLTTGQVSITISRGDDDLYIEIVDNGPEVQVAMCRLLERESWKRDVVDVTPDASTLIEFYRNL